MSKATIGALVVLVLIVGGYFAFKGDKQVDTLNIYNGNGTEVKNESGKKMAFSQFIKNPNGSYKCEVKQAMSDMENSGTVYISDGNIAGDYTTIAEGRTMKTWFIMRDGYSYMWGDMMQGSGFKVKIPQVDTTTNTNANTSGTYSWNAEQIGDYNCEEWKVTEATFKVPTNITFKDLSEISAGTNPTASVSASMCNASKGTWSAEYKECNGISENTCKSIGGSYNGCASACRHDPKAEICTMQCVQICTLK
jgi:hypothetical protein